jgi:hypothetical protein
LDMNISPEVPSSPQSPQGPLWRVNEIPKPEEPVVPEQARAAAFPASLYLAQEREATDHEQDRKDRLMDNAGFTENKAEEERVGDYLSKYPSRAPRKKRHHFPSKVPDGDTGLNDPFYAGPKDVPVFTDDDRNHAEEMAKTTRLERIKRDTLKFISEGMDPEMAENRAYALHRNHTGEVIDRPSVFKSPAQEFIVKDPHTRETHDESLDALLPVGIAPETAPESREHIRRLRDGMDRFGFYFRTLKEGNKINRFTTKAKSGIAVVDYLDMIYRESREGDHSSNTEVERAFETIAGFATEALDTITMIQDFEDQLASDHLRPGGHLTEAEHFPVADWAQDMKFIDTLTRLAHYVDIAEFARTGKNDVLFKKNRIDNTSGEERIKRILDTLGGFTIDELRSVCTTAVESEYARFKYWQARTKEAEIVAPVHDRAEARSYALQSRALGIEL